jgi:mannitol-specific phosphotransferase system IIBC component
MGKMYYLLGGVIGAILVISYLVTASQSLILSVLGMCFGAVLGLFLQSLSKKKQHD